MLTEVSFQGKKVAVGSSEEFVTLISKSCTKTGVGSFTTLVFATPGKSVQEIEADKAAGGDEEEPEF